MESLLFLSKLSAVITVLYAGLNIHQLTSSYQYLLDKANEFRAVIGEEADAPRLIRLNLVFYVVIPIIYLTLLRHASIPGIFIALLALKFAITAGLDIWVEKTLLNGMEYTKTQHYCSRADNLVNLGAALGVIYFLVFGSTTI